MVYLAIPIDLIPDLVPILGYADDAIIVVAVLSSVVRQVGIDQVRAHWTGTDDGFNALCKAAVPTGSRSGSNGSTGPPPIRPRVIQTRSGMEGVAVSAQRVGAVGDLPAGKVIGVGRYAVGNADGRYFAVTRRCRHLGADLAAGSIDDDAAWSAPCTTRPTTSRPAGWSAGPQGIFAKVPGLDFGYRMLTRVLPLRRAPMTERDGELYIDR
jgi:hypothetical protein